MNQNILLGVSQVMAQARATGLFVSLCTIQAPTAGEAGISASGAPLGTFTNVSGLVDIACMDAPQPPNEIKLGSTESRAPGQVTDATRRHVLLDDYYPTIITGWRSGWQAVVDGVIYDIAGAECDSQRQMVRLELQLATAGAIQS